MRKRSKWATEQPQAAPAVRVQRSASRRVLGSSLRVTAEKPLHGQHGFGIMATRQMRLRLRSGIYAARDVARPGASASRARVESGLKDGGIASPRNITTSQTPVDAARYSRAGKIFFFFSGCCVIILSCYRKDFLLVSSYSSSKAYKNGIIQFRGY